MMKRTALLLSATALLGLASCHAAATTPQKSATSSSHAAKTLTVTTQGVLYAIGDQYVLFTGSDTAKFNSVSALRAHFQDGVRVSEARYLQKNSPLSVYKVAQVPENTPTFAQVQVTTKVPQAQTQEAHIMTVDFTDTKQIPSIQLSKLTVLN
jgi:hypothetical protein